MLVVASTTVWGWEEASPCAPSSMHFWCALDLEAHAAQSSTRRQVALQGLSCSDVS